jgi:Sulfatase
VEFAVLTGLAETALGLDRFNPYFRFARRQVPSLASALRAAGYATAYLHPFDRRFFARDRVLPALGFERFEDETAFAGAPRIGRYVADAAIAARVVEELVAARGGAARFLFAITMQAHGPWPDPDPLGAWLAHLRDADAMLGMIAEAVPRLDRPLVLAVYGDHLPALPERPADGLATDFLVWRSDLPGEGARRDLEPAGLHAAIRAAVEGSRGGAVPLLAHRTRRLQVAAVHEAQAAPRCVAQRRPRREGTVGKGRHVPRIGLPGLDRLHHRRGQLGAEPVQRARRWRRWIPRAAPWPSAPAPRRRRSAAPGDAP